MSCYRTIGSPLPPDSLKTPTVEGVKVYSPDAYDRSKKNRHDPEKSHGDFFISVAGYNSPQEIGLLHISPDRRSAYLNQSTAESVDFGWKHLQALRANH